jgi:hypothetical protein
LKKPILRESVGEEREIEPRLGRANHPPTTNYSPYTASTRNTQRSPLFSSSKFNRPCPFGRWMLRQRTCRGRIRSRPRPLHSAVSVCHRLDGRRGVAPHRASSQPPRSSFPFCPCRPPQAPLLSVARCPAHSAAQAPPRTGFPDAAFAASTLRPPVKAPAPARVSQVAPLPPDIRALFGKL